MAALQTRWLTGSRLTDYSFAFAFSAFFFFARAFMIKNVYAPLGNMLLATNGKAGGPTLEMLRKWNESCWKMTVYITFTTLALMASFREPWFWDTTLFWVGCTRLPCMDLYVSVWVLLFYCAETGFYIQAIPFLLYEETRRRDWKESLIHHVVTLLLLTYSYYLNLTRVGIMILLCHDVADIFLECAKLARYCRKQVLAILIFIAFFVVWMVTRVIYFPLVILRSTLFESIELVAKPLGIPTSPHWEILNSALVLIFILNVYWSWLIFKVIIKQLTVGDAGDIREKDE